MPDPSRPRLTDRLFLALFPNAKAAERANAVAANLVKAGQISGKLQAVERLHVTLAFLGDWPGLSPALLERAVRASEAVARGGPAFEAAFDQAISFKGRPGHQPLVLTGGSGLDTLRQFQQTLNRALAGEGLAAPTGSYTPHMTLAYGDSAIEDQAITPIGWRVTEFSLVHSAMGQARYHILGRWRLDY